MKTRFAACMAACLAAGCAMVAGPSNYETLPLYGKTKAIKNALRTGDFGRPQHKAMCRDLIASQGGYAGAEPTDAALQAIALAERQGWDDMIPGLDATVKNPRNVTLMERAYRACRKLSGNPVSGRLAAGANTMMQAGRQGSRVTEAQLDEARGAFIEEKDRDAVLVYAMTVAATAEPKAGSKRGRRAAAEFLRVIDRKKVASRLHRLMKNGNAFDREAVEWLMGYLGVKAR